MAEEDGSDRLNLLDIPDGIAASPASPQNPSARVWFRRAGKSTAPWSTTATQNPSARAWFRKEPEDTYERKVPLGMTPVYYVDSVELIELYPEKPMPLIIPESVKAEFMATAYEAWVDAGRPKARKALRLRVEPGGAAARGWLTLLALCGWMRGVVVWDGVGPFSGVGA